MNLLEKYITKLKQIERQDRLVSDILETSTMKTYQGINDNNDKIQDDLIFDWCRDVCMLTEWMSKLCEVKRPCPKYGDT